MSGASCLFALVSAFSQDQPWLLPALLGLAQFAFLLGTSFRSGALEAWDVDSLRSRGAMASFDRLFTRLQFFQNLGVIAGGGIGLLLLQLTGIAWMPWPLFSSGTLLLAGFAWRNMGPDGSENRGREVPAMGRAIVRVWHNTSADGIDAGDRSGFTVSGAGDVNGVAYRRGASCAARSRADAAYAGTSRRPLTTPRLRIIFP